MINLTPTLTQAGLALFNGQSPGFSVIITHIAFGGSKYDPVGFEATLKAELARFPIDGAAEISPSSIQVGVLMKNAAPDGRSANDKWIGEIGFYAGNTLFAVLSQAAAYLFYKSPDIDIPVTYVLDFSALPPGSITVDNSHLSASIALSASYAQTAAKTALDVQKYITSSYYGAFAVAPATRPDGTPRQRGDRYFDTAANAERTWDGTVWGIPNVNAVDLLNATDQTKGSARIGHQGGTVRDALLATEAKLQESEGKIQALTAGQSASVLGFDTRASLNASLGFPENTVAYVTNDPTPENNTTYRKIGVAGAGSWQISSAAPVDVLAARIGELLSHEPSDTFQQEASALRRLMLAVTDASDRVALGLTEDGAVVASILQVLANLSSPKVSVESPGLGGVELVAFEANYDFAIVDENDNVAFGTVKGAVKSADVLDYATVPLKDRDQLNQIKANKVKDAIGSPVARNVYKYNHIVVYGQSLATGMESWPALSKASKYGNLMLGDHVRQHTATYLRPLVSNVINEGSNTILTDEQVAALPAGNGAEGEVVNHGLCNFAKRMHNDHVIAANDTQHLFVTTNNGVAGRTIEQLSKGNATGNYNRFATALNNIRAIAAAEGATYGVTGIVWMQGEWNYISTYGGTTEKDGYKSLLAQLRNDMNADIVAATGQDRMPAFLTYQTGAAYTRDATNLSVGMAQWEFARENVGCFMAGPIYPYTDKGGHMDANGERWFGNMLGKIYHRVVTLGQGWKPLAPTAITTQGTDILIDFHVPEPPLAFDLPYVVLTATDYANKGFRVTDDSGEVPIVSVSIVADTVVKIALSRAPAANAFVWYASQSTGGGGCLRDSDGTIAHDKYEYNAGTGQYAGANIPALVGKPYPLQNWCIAFRLPTTWSE